MREKPLLITYGFLLVILYLMLRATYWSYHFILGAILGMENRSLRLLLLLVYLVICKYVVVDLFIQGVLRGAYKALYSSLKTVCIVVIIFSVIYTLYYIIPAFAKYYEGNDNFFLVSYLFLMLYTLWVI